MILLRSLRTSPKLNPEVRAGGLDGPGRRL